MAAGDNETVLTDPASKSSWRSLKFLPYSKHSVPITNMILSALQADDLGPASHHDIWEYC